MLNFVFTVIVISGFNYVHYIGLLSSIYFLALFQPERLLKVLARVSFLSTASCKNLKPQTNTNRWQFFFKRKEKTFTFREAGVCIYKKKKTEKEEPALGWGRA